MVAYAITDPSTLNFQTLAEDIRRFSQRAGMIVYRDQSTLNYAENANSFLEETANHAFQQVLLHADYQLAHRLKADGVHLQSTQFDKIAKAKALGLFVVISTHSLEEALKAEALGADKVTFSPIFPTPNKGKPKGVVALQKVVERLSIGVIALGGVVSQNEILLCRESGAEGFASIRYFMR